MRFHKHMKPAGFEPMTFQLVSFGIELLPSCGSLPIPSISLVTVALKDLRAVRVWILANTSIHWRPAALITVMCYHDTDDSRARSVLYSYYSSSAVAMSLTFLLLLRHWFVISSPNQKRCHLQRLGCFLQRSYPVNSCWWLVLSLYCLKTDPWTGSYKEIFSKHILIIGYKFRVNSFVRSCPESCSNYTGPRYELLTTGYEARTLLLS